MMLLIIDLAILLTSSVAKEQRVKSYFMSLFITCKRKGEQENERK